MVSNGENCFITTVCTPVIETRLVSQKCYPSGLCMAEIVQSNVLGGEIWNFQLVTPHYNSTVMVYVYTDGQLFIESTTHYSKNLDLFCVFSSIFFYFSYLDSGMRGFLGVLLKEHIALHLKL